MEKCKQVITHPDFIDKRKRKAEDEHNKLVIDTKDTCHQESETEVSAHPRKRLKFFTNLFRRKKGRERIPKVLQKVYQILPQK